jgi:hypothetical protein
MRYKCNSCGATYSDPLPDGSAYFHVCPPGTENPRNENAPAGLQYFDGKPHLVASDPEDRARRVAKLVESTIISEGKGRKLVEQKEE